MYRLNPLYWYCRWLGWLAEKREKALYEWEEWND